MADIAAVLSTCSKILTGSEPMLTISAVVKECVHIKVGSCSRVVDLVIVASLSVPSRAQPLTSDRPVLCVQGLEQKVPHRKSRILPPFRL